MGVKQEGDYGDFYNLDPKSLDAVFTLIAQKHYPHRIPPKEWPSLVLTGKAMVRGWAIPCRYYPRPWRRGGHQPSFVWPGITDAEMTLMHVIMGKEHKC